MADWYKIYKELAELLKKFYYSYGNKSGKELFKRCSNDGYFFSINNRIATFFDDFNIASIDPIHVFASLNEAGYSIESRTKRLNNFFKILGSDEVYYEIDFTGCPFPLTIKIMAARKDEVQKEIWDVFFNIVSNGQDGLNQEVFDKIKNWYGIDIVSFTMFLFWIDSDNFLSLDRNTNNFFIKNNIYKKRPRNYDEYKIRLPKKNTDLYRKTVIYAYNPKDTPVFLSEYTGVIDSYLDVKFDEEKSTFDFKLIAIKTLKKNSSDVLKILKPNHTYTFYNCFDFTDTSNIKYLKEKNFKFYNITDTELKSGQTYNLDINISAIVGKNGSGKSSITELLYMAINNLAYRALGDDSNLTYYDNLYIELYYYTNTLFRLKIEGKKISITRFANTNDVFIPKANVTINRVCLEDFFYSIAINYSHFALNSLEIGQWINNVFYKNDEYQVPLAINPIRKEGNIDVNLESSFVKSRILSNILEPVADGENISSNLRQITDNGRKADKLKLSLNEEKVAYLYKTYEGEIVSFPSEEEQKFIIDEVYWKNRSN
jgi:hypothetical protein